MRLAFACVLAISAAATAALAQSATRPIAATSQPAAAVAPDDTDGPAYAVAAFEPSFVVASKGVPTVDALRNDPIALGQTADGYVVPPSLEAIYLKQLYPDQRAPSVLRSGVTPVRRSLADLARDGKANYHASAIWAINYQLVQSMNRRGLIGVYVNPDPADLNDAGTDLRGDRLDLKILISVGQVRALRTVASGSRIAERAKINNPLHERIVRQSPVQPGDVLNKNLIDDYVAGLNRFPGRRVDAAIAASGTTPSSGATTTATTGPDVVDAPGGVDLDYLVDERRPLTLYAQISNTGTRQTSQWRERLGFTYSQLANRDDVFSADYTTAGFDSSHAVVVGYEFPIPNAERLRLRTSAYYNEFTASDVGQGDFNFDGDEYGVSGELSANLYQRRELFVDAFASLRLAHYRVGNDAAGSAGNAGFALPTLGLRAERATEKASLSAQAAVIAGFSDASHDDLDALGRTDASKDFYGFQLDATQSFYLEPLLNPRGFRDDPTHQTLANELAVSFRGQWIPNERLIPQEQRIVGGFETVRGYDEAVTAGDTTLVGSLEYRLHIPRTFAVQEDPSKTPLFGQPFKFAPQYAFGRPDWDLIFRTFVDVGRVYNNDRTAFERDETLVGTGVGLELQFRENASIRLDYGIALSDAGDSNGGGEHTDAGDSRLHVVATFTY